LQDITNFDSYQEFTKSLAVYNTDVLLETVDHHDDVFDVPVVSTCWMPYVYPLLALGEEAGEVQGKVAKFIRKSQQGVTDDMVKQLRMDVAKELGDLLYQVSETARQFNFSLQEIVDMNVGKLLDRQARNVLVGEGDNR